MSYRGPRRLPIAKFSAGNLFVRGHTLMFLSSNLPKYFQHGKNLEVTQVKSWSRKTFVSSLERYTHATKNKNKEKEKVRWNWGCKYLQYVLERLLKISSNIGRVLNRANFFSNKINTGKTVPFSFEMWTWYYFELLFHFKQHNLHFIMHIFTYIRTLWAHIFFYGRAFVGAVKQIF